MYTLHIGNKNYSSWSLRPWVLLTHLGIPFEERLHFFPSDRPSYPEFSKFSPTGFVPVLDDGDIKAVFFVGSVGNGLVETAVLGLCEPVRAVGDFVERICRLGRRDRGRQAHGGEKCFRLQCIIHG